jgi:hypothetical protein
VQEGVFVRRQRTLQLGLDLPLAELPLKGGLAYFDFDIVESFGCAL